MEIAGLLKVVDSALPCSTMYVIQCIRKMLVTKQNLNVLSTVCTTVYVQYMYIVYVGECSFMRVYSTL